MAKYLTCAETAKLVRKALKARFGKKQKFSVRSKTYSGGASIDVSWTDGPTTREVDKVAKLFAGATFDGMIDLKSHHTSLLSNEDGSVEEVRFGSDFVFTHREISEAAREAIIDDLRAELGEEPKGYMPIDAREYEGKPVWVHGGANGSNDVGTLVYRYAHHLDLSNGIPPLRKVAR